MGEVVKIRIGEAMDKKYWENQEITVYWWNMGKKTLDYRGTYKGFLEAKDIKVFNISKNIGKNGIKGNRFLIPLASCVATLDSFSSDYFQGCDDAIKIFLTLLGDRTKFITPRREFNINW
jgi:hypothetical protein